jgi:hypothetical protein
LVMGFDTHMIAGSRACSTSTRPTHPTITNETSPHYAEALIRTRWNPHLQLAQCSVSISECLCHGVSRPDA